MLDSTSTMLNLVHIVDLQMYRCRGNPWDDHENTYLGEYRVFGSPGTLGVVFSIFWSRTRPSECYRVPPHSLTGPRLPLGRLMSEMARQRGTVNCEVLFSQMHCNSSFPPHFFLQLINVLNPAIHIPLSGLIRTFSIKRFMYDRVGDDDVLLLSL